MRKSRYVKEKVNLSLFLKRVQQFSSLMPLYQKDVVAQRPLKRRTESSSRGHAQEGILGTHLRTYRLCGVHQVTILNRTRAKSRHGRDCRCC